MTSDDSSVHARFGIDEIYIHPAFPFNLLEKLSQRAHFFLDANDQVILKYVTHDMILIFDKQKANPSLIYRFLESLDRNVDKENYILANTLLNENEIFSAIKSKTYVLVTHRMLPKDMYHS